MPRNTIVMPASAIFLGSAGSFAIPAQLAWIRNCIGSLERGDAVADVHEARNVERDVVVGDQDVAHAREPAAL